MPNVKISQLPAVSSVLGTDVVPVVASSTTSKITVSDLLSSVNQVSSSISASYALTASYVLNAITSSDFPYTGSARITGSLDLIGPSLFTDNVEAHYRDRFKVTSTYTTSQVSTAQHSLAIISSEAIITTSSINNEFDRSAIQSVDQILLNSGSYTFRGDMDYPYAGILNRVNVGSNNNSGDITVNFVNRGFGGSVEGLNGNYVRVDFWPADSGIVKKTITGNVTAYNAIYDIEAAVGSSVETFNYYVAGNYRNWTGKVPFTNLYGFRVVPMDPRGVNRWAIYQQGPNDRNYFAGSISVGTTQTGSFTVDVSGSGRYTNGLQVTSSLQAPNITGSLFGTSSWALSAISSSYPFAISGSTIYSNTGEKKEFSTTESILIGRSAGSSSIVASNLVAIGTEAAYSAVSAYDAVIIGKQAGYEAYNAYESVIIGKQAGYGAKVTIGSVLIGSNASSGSNVTNSGNNTIIGYFSGANSNWLNGCTILGSNAGRDMITGSGVVLIGTSAGQGVKNSNGLIAIGASAAVNTDNASGIIIGTLAGYNVISASSVTYIGESAGFQATNAKDSIFIGYRSGYTASNALRSNFIGYNAGEGASAAVTSNFIGQLAGTFAISASESNFIGDMAGFLATTASYSNFIGYQSGQSATRASGSNFIGNSSGLSARAAENSNFIGTQVGQNSESSSFSNYIGYKAGSSLFGSSTGRNNIVIGTNVTLEVNRSNSINIAGLIFGTGSYSTITGNPFSGSANGRIGINQPNPTRELDVSGSLQVSNFVILTRVSQSLNFADDTAAAAGGVPLGGLYRSGSSIQIRLV